MIPALTALLGSLVGTAGNALGGIFSAGKSAQEAEKNRQFQAYEASLSRQFNADEAQKNRDFQLSMYNSTNQYNDPSSVMSRLQKAGINPALAYSGGQLGTASMQGGSQASSSSSPSGAMADYSGYQHMFDPLAMSQVALNEAQARKLNSEASKTDTENEYISKYFDLASNNSQFDNNLKDSIAALNDAERRTVNATLRNLDTDTMVKQSLNMLYHTQATGQMLDNLLTEKTFNDVVKRIQSESKISEADAKLAYALGLSIIRSNNSRADSDDANTKYLKQLETLTGYNADVLKPFSELGKAHAAILSNPDGNNQTVQAYMATLRALYSARENEANNRDYNSVRAGGAFYRYAMYAGDIVHALVPFSFSASQGAATIQSHSSSSSQSFNHNFNHNY